MISISVLSVVIIGVALILVPGALHGLQFSKTQAAFWDFFLKGIAGVVAISTFIIAASKYLDERRIANRTAAIEASKPFFEKRQEVYCKLVTATSTIANRNMSDKKRKESVDDFWLLYWGELPLVADEAVGKAADTFSEILFHTPKKNVDLRNKSMDLARACRRSLGFQESTEGASADTRPMPFDEVAG